MVIGNGLIGSAFKDYKDDENIIIFASGVSSSTEYRQEEFDREKTLLSKTMEENPEKCIVYFTSFLSENEDQRKYVEHKKI